MSDLITDQDKVKRAVKEALDDKRMEDLSTQMTNLATQMTAGFSAVHTRQDTTNGKVIKNTSDIEQIRSKDRYDKLIWFIVTVLVSIVVYFLTKGNR